MILLSLSAATGAEAQEESAVLSGRVVAEPDGEPLAFRINQFFTSRRLLAAEAYRTENDAPQGYTGPPGCGVVFLWTRPIGGSAWEPGAR